MAIYTDFKEFVHNIPTRGKLMAIDWGARRVGLALSDISMEYIFPYGTFCAPVNILQIIHDENILGIVVGLPQHADGTDSETTARVRSFANDLLGLTDLPIVFVDEVLSSTAALDLMKSSPKSEQNKGLDAFAAAVILEDAISTIKRVRNNG